MKSVAFHNLGCKVNAYEMDVMQQSFEENGYRVVPFDQTADIYIVNTCTVTNIADRKSRQMLHRAKQRNPQAVVVAVGCYVQAQEGRILAENGNGEYGCNVQAQERRVLAENGNGEYGCNAQAQKGRVDASIDLAVGNNRKKDIVQIVERFLEERERAGSAGGFPQDVAGAVGGALVIDIGRTDEYEEMTLRRTAEHTRAYIKIQDGCNQFCSYCIIPYVRGRVRSRRAEDILTEVQGLAAAGYREIVLTGIHISSYGMDFDGQRAYAGQAGLIDLLERIHREAPGLERIRIGSLEPRFITEETARRLSALPKLCPHFHLSLQSGCEETLKRMNRHYTPVEYLQKVELLREVFEHPAITTDVIVGFPGETEEEFAQTEDFVRRVGFYETHIFKYSRRAGTRAASMPDQLTEKEKSARSDALFAIEREQSRAFRGFYIGKRVEVLWESEREIEGGLYWIGHTRDYVKVAFPMEHFSTGRKGLSGEIRGVLAERFLTEEILLGTDLGPELQEPLT